MVELKVTELKSEHIGQIEKYMNYIDKNIKTVEEDKTIGIIISIKIIQIITILVICVVIKYILLNYLPSKLNKYLTGER